MSMSSDHLLETALSLPMEERASLAFHLLESLDPPGDEITADEFSAELSSRVEAYRRGEVQSSGLEKVRGIIEQKLAEGNSP